MDKIEFFQKKKGHHSYEGDSMKRYVCNACGYVYDPATGDPDSGIAAGTPFENLPDDWVCPQCGVGKEDFTPEE
jgi:rubredoxin